MFRSKIRFLVIPVVFIIVAVLSAGIAMAQSADPPVPPTVPALTDVLAMLANGVGVGAVIAFLFEKVGWFQNMAPNTKWWTIFGLSLGLPVLARVILQFVPPDVWAVIEPYWVAIATGFLIWAGGQAFHLYSQRTA
jgi:hypothetical protein